MIPAKVKNWPKFQHYRHRAPTWIKLHRALLDDFAFVCLPTVAKAVLPLVWLLAAEGDGDGKFDASPEYLAFRFRMPVLEVAAATVPLVNQGFIELSAHHASELLARCDRITREGAQTVLAAVAVASEGREPLHATVHLEDQRVTPQAPADASNVLAIGYQPARPETETETEKSKSKSKPRSSESTVGHAPETEAGEAPAADEAGAGQAASPGEAIAHSLPAKGGELIPFTRADVLELAELYPLVDVDAEMRQIRGWLMVRETRRKVGRKGTRRMVATWLGKEQRRLADAARNGKPAKPPNAVGATFDHDQHQAQGAGFWLDPPSTETSEHDPDR